jgi:serine/threonine protein kinase
VLGKGNFASVFLAKEKSSGREVAIKVLSKTRLVKPKQQKSVQTEIGVMMSLQKHVNTTTQRLRNRVYMLTI